MPTAGNSAAQAPVDDARRRWEEMLGNLAELLPARSRRLLIDGPADRAEFFASRLGEKLAGDRRALGGLLILFHPSGRAALAARHGNALSPDEPLSEGPLRRFTATTGWELTAYDDAPHRFFAVAERR